MSGLERGDKAASWRHSPRQPAIRRTRRWSNAMPPLDKVYDYDQYGGLKVEKQDKVMTITLNAPETMNAFSAEMHYSMSRIWEDVQDDPEVHVVVLTGAGRAFSAGGNVIAMQQKIDRPELWDATSLPEAKRIIFGMLECDKPMIARVNGHAVGLAAGAMKSIRWTKQVINVPLRQIAHSMMDLSISLETQSNLTKDHQEAVTAFTAKRRPNFTGG